MINWYSERSDIIIEQLTHFDPVHTFECGQCFRWNLLQNGNWRGVAMGHAAEISWDGENLIFYHTSEEVFRNVWLRYFDFERDYGKIKESLSFNDPVMRKAIEFGHGIRLLRQDFSEVLISFIISQNNGIPRIKKIVESLAENFGEPINYMGSRLYAFPDMEKIEPLTSQDIKIIRAGYRDKYILNTARQIINKQVEYCRLNDCDTSEARNEMLKLSGVGPKVADCILLFSGTKYDLFPVDRWVRRVMAELYLGYEADYDELTEFSERRFGNLAGFAQQYLFHYARAHKIGKA